MRHIEDGIQAGIVVYLRTILDHRLYRVFAVPNGGRRGKAEAARMKATGTLPGVADLIITGPGGASWWIEVKKPGGTSSEAQRVLQRWAGEVGLPYAIVHGIDEVRVFLRQHGVPMREVLVGRAA